MNHDDIDWQWRTGETGALHVAATHLPTGTQAAARIDTPSSNPLQDEAALRHTVLQQLHAIIDPTEHEEVV